jgi:hypothetical protein
MPIKHESTKNVGLLVALQVMDVRFVFEDSAYMLQSLILLRCR